MELSDLLDSGSVVANLRATSKKQALQELARKAADVTGLDERKIFGVLMDRERLGTTGVGSGIAIPHGKLPELDRLYGIFARLEKPVDFQSIDDRPVDLIFVLLAPEEAGADHLKALARVSRLLRDHDVCDKLRGTGEVDALFAIMTESQETRAA
ncbi:MAG: PTS IIA-like nitrogen regulatory protein PtsN [Rhodospirillales bacterium]|nr:PTS IIA-like nitrogen regulatory protein PtsN [Rhodospirillales bacterium]MBO6787860.1 PTS IIA-like nitrogen regulatory protein PtsN [Rhodospirillales bacterium]